MRHFQVFRKIPAWTAILTAVVSGLLGIFAGPILETYVPPLTDVRNLPVIIFVLSSLVFVVVIALWTKTQNDISNIRNDFRTVVSSLGVQTHFFSYDAGYDWLAEKYKEVNNEVLIFTNYILLPDKETEYSKKIKSPSRIAVYKNAIRRIEHFFNNEDTDFRIVRIVKLPLGLSLSEVHQRDTLFYEASKILTDFGRKRPEFASLRITDIAFRNTFVLLDGKFLYMELDTEPIGDSKVSVMGDFIPYSIVVEDPTGHILQDMRSLFRRMEVNSRVVSDV